MKTTVTAAAAIALAVLTAPGAFASRYHVIHHMHNGMHHMHNGMHHMRVKMHHGHIHMHNMMYRGHM